MALAEQGHQCDEAADGSEALTMLAGANFDLVLLDIAMPAVGGIEVLEALGPRDSGGPEVVIITAQKTPEIHERARNLGCRLLVTKPFETRWLVGRLEALLGDGV